MKDNRGGSMKFILDVQERLKENLTTKQIIVILNTLINKACKPVFHKSFFMRECVLQSVLQTQDDHRRKIAVTEKVEAAGGIINGVVFNRYDFIESCELNRSILYSSLKVAWSLWRVCLS